MNPLIYGGDAPYALSRDGLVAYATTEHGRTVWTSCPVNGAHQHSSGDTAQEAVDNWRKRWGSPNVERKAA